MTTPSLSLLTVQQDHIVSNEISATTSTAGTNNVIITNIFHTKYYQLLVVVHPVSLLVLLVLGL